MDLCSLGYQNQLCIDFSEIVISQMRQRYESIPIEWRVMDVREMDLPNDHVDLAIDKVWISLVDFPTHWHLAMFYHAHGGVLLI